MNILSNDIIFSLYEDKDYDGFYNCINNFYDGGYPYKEFLDRKNLQALLNAGDIIITLAKHNSRIVGTSAALRMNGRFSGSVLLLLRSVVKDMRGKSIGTNQEHYLLQQIHNSFPDALSLYADVMTHDAISQNTMIKRGFIFCGLRMTLYKNEIIVPNLTYKSGTKMTQAIYCKGNNIIKECSVFAPKAHHETLRELYSSLGVSLNFLPDTACTTTASYEIQASTLHQKAELFVDIHGSTKNYINEIKELLSSGYTAVAYINMSRCGFNDTYNALTELGFYFSGVKPLSSNGEYLVLSHSKNCLTVIDDIKLPKKEPFLYKTIAEEIKK